MCLCSEFNWSYASGYWNWSPKLVSHMVRYRVFKKKKEKKKETLITPNYLSVCTLGLIFWYFNMYFIIWNECLQFF